MSDNRRQSYRHDVRVPAQVTLPSVTSPTGQALSNLSLGGAFIDGLVLQMGQRLHLSFSVPTQATAIETEATVRFTSVAGSGVQFDGLRARDVWALTKFFEQLSQ